MPRRKTTQPAPAQFFKLDDGTEVEVRDHQTRLVGRGLDKKYLAEETQWQVLTGLVDDLQSGEAKRVFRAETALSSNHAIERYLHDGGYGFDERTGRRYGREIRAKFKQFREIQGAVEVDSWQVPSPPSSLP